MEATYGYLKLQSPGSGDQQFEVSKSEITIGRGQTNDIVLQDSRVSRSHARFDFDAQGGVTVVDLGSTNGVRVNGIRVERAAVQPGDVVFIGGSQITFGKGAREDEALTIIDSEADLDRTMAESILPVSINDTAEDRLVVCTSERTWEVPLDAGVDSLSIGRSAGNNVAIEHASISRTHARLTRDRGTFILKDLDSSNGLWVNGQRQTEIVLEDGMSVRLGYATLIFKRGFQEQHLTIAGGSFKVPGRRPVVFVPGIMGSELWLGKERIWPNLKVLFKEPELFKYPGLSGIEARGILQELVVVPNLIKLEQYSRLGDYLVENLGYTRGTDFFEFAYDWRQDVRKTARQLAQFIDALPVVPPVKIIAHSLGTLVSRYYIERCGGRDKVDRLILMGGPHLGTPNAVSSLLFGPEVLPFGLLGEKLRKVISTFETSYQILPVYSCGVDQFGQPFNFMKEDSWLTQEQRPLWQAAREFKRELGTKTTVPTTCIFGYGQKTVDRIKLLRKPDGTLSNSVYETRANGDGSVPENSAILEGTDFHPVHQLHGVLFIDNDVKMRLRLELIGKPFM